MDQTEQRIREISHVLKDRERWRTTVRELGICLTYKVETEENSMKFHRYVSWEDLRLARVNPLLAALSIIERDVERMKG